MTSMAKTLFDAHKLHVAINLGGLQKNWQKRIKDVK
jgi:hypothetical protein